MMLPETTLKTRSDQIKTLCKKLRKIKVRSTLASMFLQDAKAENILFFHSTGIQANDVQCVNNY